MPGSIHLNRSWTAASVTGNPSLPPPLFPEMWTNISFLQERWNLPPPIVLHWVRFILFFIWVFGLLVQYFICFRQQLKRLYYRSTVELWCGHHMRLLLTVTSITIPVQKKKRLLLVLVVLVTYFGWSLTHTWENSVSTICCSNPITGTAFFPLVLEKTSIPLSSPDSVHIVGYFSECVVWEVCTTFLFFYIKSSLGHCCRLLALLISKRANCFSVFSIPI